MVAEVTMSLRSRRRERIFLNKPMRTSVLSERSCASSRMIQLYRSKSPSFKDSRRSTPSVMSAPKLIKSYKLAGRLAFDPCFGGRTIFESNRISNNGPKLALHLLANTLSDRHSCHTSRLCAAYHSRLAISVLVQKLCQLSRLARPRFANDNHH